MQIFFISMLHLVVLSLLNKKSMKRFACDIYLTLLPLSSLVYDVTNSDCWVQNGSTHSYIFISAVDF